MGALVALFGVTCSDGSLTGPRSSKGGLSRVGFAPVFTQAASDIFQNLEAFGYEVNNVHVVLTHANGHSAKDTVVVVAPGQDSVAIQMSVNLDATQEDLSAAIELRDDNTILFTGTQKISAKVGSTTP